MNPYLRASLLCFAIVVTAMFWGIVFFGCSVPTVTETHEATVLKVVGDADIAVLRAQYQEVADCWGITPEPWQSVNMVIILHGGTNPNGAQWFQSPECERGLREGGYWPEYTACAGVVVGSFFPRSIQVTPNLAAFRHEVSHIFRPDVRHGGGRCWL